MAGIGFVIGQRSRLLRPKTSKPPTTTLMVCPMPFRPPPPQQNATISTNTMACNIFLVPVKKSVLNMCILKHSAITALKG